MANRLKVGFLKEIEMLKGTEMITPLVVDEKSKWSCSESIDSQLQDELTENEILGTYNRYILVDEELSQTRGVQVVDDNTVNNLDIMIRHHLKNLCSENNFENSLNDDHLKIMRKVVVLTKALFAVKQDNEFPREGKWLKVITAEL